MAAHRALWDVSYPMETPETPLQRFVRLALEALPRARDHYDKQIQALSGTKGKPLYDLHRSKALNPRTPMLKHMATVLGQPFELLRRASEGEQVDPVPSSSGATDVPANIRGTMASLEDIAAEHGLVLVEEIDLAFGMGATFLNQDTQPEVVGMVPFRTAWLREMFRGALSALKVVRGIGDSMDPTIRSGDFVLIDTSRQRIDEQDAIWAICYGELGMIRRLRQLPGGGVMMMPDNQLVRPTEAYDGEMAIIGKVIWIGRRM